MKIGIAGIGRMGAAMGERMLDQGVELVVWNRSPGRTGPLVEKGAEEVPTAAALAEAADVILTILTDERAIAAVYDGADGLLSGPRDGKLFIDMSTVKPAIEVALAERVRARGAGFVECPVSGSVVPAQNGKLFGFAGGSDADVARARPVLERFCRRVEHVGEVGAGSSVKLAVNLPLAVYWQALGEALTLFEHLGLPGERIVDIIADTSGGPKVLATRGPGLAKALDGGKLPGTFDINGLRKDLNTMLAEGAAKGAEMPVTRATLEAYDRSAGEGFGGFDGPQQSAYWRDTVRK